MLCRLLPIAGFAVASLASSGCAGTWDTLTSQRFRSHPFKETKLMISPEDPVAILLADPPRTGDEQAAAMRRLKEPAANRGTPEQQEAVLVVLQRAATSDPSPVVRLDAINALGRFQDARVAGILMAAYQNAHGRRPDDPTPPKRAEADIVQAGLSAGRSPTRNLDPFPTTTGPIGFPPDWVSTIRCRAAESLGHTSQPEAAKFLATVAGGAGADVAIEGGDDRDVKLAAIRGLGKCRQPEAVYALAQVLTAEAEKKDIAVIGRTHEGLVRLTGKKLPPNPQDWNGVVQAGVVIAPEPTWLDTAVDNAVFWKKQ